MTPQTLDRLFGYQNAFSSPVTLGVTLAILGILLAAAAITFLLRALGKTSPALHKELLLRIASWAVMTPLLIGPILLGAAWTIAGITALSLLCYREFARATGLFRHRILSATIALGILLLGFASLDHWYRLFVALPSLTLALLAIVAVLPDQPKGYIQRVGLATMGFLFFGVCLSHLGFMANDAHYREILILILVAVELNDVFAFISGKTFGRRKITPNTSPNKTLGGALGALLTTTLLVSFLGHFVFQNTLLASPLLLLGLGLIISIPGQFGDLMLSSIKRDLGIKDMGNLIPGHGGLLDRFDSLILVAPAAFHYINYFRGIGLDQPLRILSGN